MFNQQQITQFIVHNPGVLIVVGAAIIVFVAIRVIRTVVDFLKFTGILGAIGVVVYGWRRLSGVIEKWQKSVLKPHNHPAINIGGSELPNPQDMGGVPNNMNRVAHFNPELLAFFLIIATILGIGYLYNRALDPVTKARLNRQFQNFFSFGKGRTSKNKGDGRSEFELVDIELGINKDTGKPLNICGLDRFIGTMVVGAPGTGKTSRVLLKGAYQDLHHIARGVPMDLMVMDPDGGLADDVLLMAEKLGLDPEQKLVIDLRDEGNSTVTFNPFRGAKVHSVIDNVRAILKEQMGNQEAFFQTVQDDLIRTVIQVQLPIWPETDFIQFAQLATDPIRFKAVCQMILASPEDLPELIKLYKHEVAYVKQKFDTLGEFEKSSVLSAAKSFLQDIRTEAKLEHLEKVTKGLKLVINELATNPVMHKVLGKGELSDLNFAEFFRAGQGEKGRVIAIVTGNTPIGDLFGKLILVSFKMYLMNRHGDENTRRPLYRYIDEYHRYATDNLKDEFVQARKYRCGTMLAFQNRSQLMLRTNRDFINQVEAGSRNQVWFRPIPEDAKYLQQILGDVPKQQETHSENKLGFFGLDGRTPDRKISTKEVKEARFTLEDILYKMPQDQAIFVMTVDNQQQTPVYGITSYADVFVNQNRRWYMIGKTVNYAGNSQLRLPSFLQKLLKRGPDDGKAVRQGTQDDGVRLAEVSVTTAVAEAFEVSQTNIPLYIGPKEKYSEMAQESYLRKDANPNTVISVKPLVAGEKPENEVASTNEPITEQSKPEEAIHFTERTSTGPETRTNATSEERLCPDCGIGTLELTADNKRYVCNTCEYTKKNRKI